MKMNQRVDIVKDLLLEKREKFVRGQLVRVSKKENLKGCSKHEKGWFLEIGKVLEACGGTRTLLDWRVVD